MSFSGELAQCIRKISSEFVESCVTIVLGRRFTSPSDSGANSEVDSSKNLCYLPSQFWLVLRQFLAD